MTWILLALLAVGLPAAYLLGVRVGVRATRTTDGRHRFGGHVVEPVPLQGPAPAGGAVHSPPTVGIPKVDGSMPTRLPVGPSHVPGARW